MRGPYATGRHRERHNSKARPHSSRRGQHAPRQRCRQHGHRDMQAPLVGTAGMPGVGHHAHSRAAEGQRGQQRGSDQQGQAAAGSGGVQRPWRRGQGDIIIIKCLVLIRLQLPLK